MQSLMPPIDSSDNLFHDGNPLTGEKGTIVTAAFLNNQQSAVRDMQSELIAILTAASMVPDAATAGQVLSAIKRVMLSSNNNYFIDSGAANNIVITPKPAFTALTDGQVFDIACAAANTGAVTLKVNALNAFPVLGMSGALQGGEIAAAKGVIRVIWSSSSNSFLLLSLNAGGALPVGPATQPNHALQLSQATGRLLNVRVFTATSPYAKTPGTRKTRFRLSGAGGGGGAAFATGSGQFSAGGGGIAGSYAETPLIDPPADGTLITVGTKGKGAAAGAPSGTAGGDSSVGSIVKAPGGGGGLSGSPSSYSNIIAQIGSPANSPTGNVLVYLKGAPAASVVGFNTGLIKGGDGGASFFGIGGAAGQSVTSSAPSPASNFGAAGGGAALGQNGSSVGGADGFDGVVIVEEYA